MSFDFFYFKKRKTGLNMIIKKNRMAVLRETSVTQSFILKVT